MSPVIKLTDIYKVYKSGNTEVVGLDHVSLTIERGEMTAIMGQSGSGKSTMLNIVGLLDRPTSGAYELGGTPSTNLSDDELSTIRNRKIGFVFQSFFLLPKLTALQNVMLPLSYRGEHGRVAKEKSMAMLEKVGIAHLHHHRPSQMSGGQQQRVALARALVGEPDVILGDEPTGALDSNTSREVMALLSELNQRDGTTIVLVTHDPKVGEQCRRVVTMQDGKIVADQEKSHEV